jgi:hypothetical protein
MCPFTIRHVFVSKAIFDWLGIVEPIGGFSNLFAFRGTIVHELSA